MTDVSETPSEAPPIQERTISPIAGRFGFGRTGKAATVAALAAGCGVFLLATARHPPAKAVEPQAPAKQVVAFEPAPTTITPTLANPGPDAPGLEPGAKAADAGLDAARRPQPAAQGAASVGESAPILAYSRGGDGPPAAAPVVPAIALARSATSEATELERPRRSAAVGVAHATRLPDRSFLVLAGSALPCVLQTAMDTATPGYVSCVVPSDVYSENGAVVLLEKGTKVLGEYRGGMKQGQTRLFVVWTRAVTPGGVAIDLASPAADALGRAGLDGDLDSHFWSRFGGAILLSVIDGGLAALGRGHAITLQAPATAATTALQGSLDIGPTLRKAPGAPVAIFVAQDLDFSAVYGVTAR